MKGLIIIKIFTLFLNKKINYFNFFSAILLPSYYIFIIYYSYKQICYFRSIKAKVEDCC